MFKLYTVVGFIKSVKSALNKYMIPIVKTQNFLVCYFMMADKTIILSLRDNICTEYVYVILIKENIAFV